MNTSPEQTPQPTPYDWRNGKWNADFKTAAEYPLYQGDYIDDLQSEVDGVFWDRKDTLYSLWGNRVYGLDCIGLTGSEPSTYCLNWYEGAEEIWRQKIDLPPFSDDAELKKGVVAFDVINNEEFVLFVQMRQEETV